MAKQRIVGERIVLKLAVEGEGWGGRIRQQIRQWGAAGMSEADIIEKLTRDQRDRRGRGLRIRRAGP
jgi:hypothetical protein